MPAVDADALSVKAEAFVAAYVEHGNAARAYRAAFDTSGMLPATIKRKAFDVLHSRPVQARVRELRAIAAEALNVSVAELALQAHEMATADVGQLAPIEIYGCRHCWGVDGRYQWRDYSELAEALTEWHASLGSPKPLKKPDERGGVGYSSRAGVNPECETCRGHGVPVLRIVPTAELSAGARALYAGVECGPDGTVRRVLAEDRSKWSHQRNQLLGIYAPARSESRNLNVSMTAAEVASIAQRSPAEIASILFANRGNKP